MRQKCKNGRNNTTMKILCIETDKSKQTVQTQIRLLLREQSDQSLQRLTCVCNIWTLFCFVKTNLFYFGDNYGIYLKCPEILEFCTIFVAYSQSYFDTLMIMAICLNYRYDRDREDTDQSGGWFLGVA